MGIASRAGDWTFKAFTASLGVATIYLAATFSANVYRGLSWHNAQSIKIHVSSILKILAYCKYERVSGKIVIIPILFHNSPISFELAEVAMHCLPFPFDLIKWTSKILESNPHDLNFNCCLQSSEQVLVNPF
ncbi:hypothetical protein DKX38_018631 [Salix brachista]|uniref:Uncharacterized protein n=1 Tax=Salix brachista TaxID=2182728 RepID=A0A5N5KNP1_9ROSI|nr:hypothetical protein DKX38_018631 [Salix brachista]